MLNNFWTIFEHITRKKSSQANCCQLWLVTTATLSTLHALSPQLLSTRLTSAPSLLFNVQPWAALTCGGHNIINHYELAPPHAWHSSRPSRPTSISSVASPQPQFRPNLLRGHWRSKKIINIRHLDYGSNIKCHLHHTHKRLTSCGYFLETMRYDIRSNGLFSTSSLSSIPSGSSPQPLKKETTTFVTSTSTMLSNASLIPQRLTSREYIMFATCCDLAERRVPTILISWLSMQKNTFSNCSVRLMHSQIKYNNQPLAGIGNACVLVSSGGDILTD